MRYQIQSPPKRTGSAQFIRAIILTSLLALAACGGGGGHGAFNNVIGGTTPPPPPSTPAAPANLSCDDSMKTAFKPDSATSVLLVRQFKAGEPLLLSGTATASTPKAGADTCVVKLLVGPGNPGPAGAPSTTAGIGIEVWLPNASAWNERIRVYGNGGFAGSDETNLAKLGNGGSGSPIPVKAAAVAKGFVISTSDDGHFGSGGAFLMNPDASINTVGWKDFSERAIHELAAKTKLLAKAFYGKPYRYAYWDGFSQGGRQGLKMAQVFPDEFDGILAGAPAVNWVQLLHALVYPQVVMQRDLGAPIVTSKLAAVTTSAIHACGGAALGFLIDPFSCHYDPAKDAAALCSGVTGNTGVVGSNSGASCVSLAEATAINKMWYGQTKDGSAPDPAIEIDSAPVLSNSHRVWFGQTRGANLAALAGPAPLSIGTDQLALTLQDPTYATPDFVNAVSNGQDKWKTLSYGELADSTAKGLLLQTQFSNINTDNPDLSAFKARKGKLIMYHGLADNLIMPNGSVNYYSRVVDGMGGLAAVQSFYRFYLIPALSHTGAFVGALNEPLPQPASGRDEMFTNLQNWVEKGVAPDRIDVSSPNAAVSLPLCVYPKKITYSGSGDATTAGSFTCN
ncbi:tannase/feruloyl esterase family alpha/beta hydrolase [Variovorax paradoxus]|uniref:Tannase/feruloyl esterase family alpha/beta hydrolase n=2 Tax=Variovorax paradoxus TaxID=34073 RepID=A0A5Q0MDG0_VARPD|nr:tannase/feruloyl esterase family alpha/beta hydrolase [Variovorax paradoxus]